MELAELALRQLRGAGAVAIRARTGLLAGLVAVVVGVGACGGSETQPGDRPASPAGDGVVLAEPTDATLVLDFVPNAVHAGIYSALADGCYGGRNLDLEVIKPTSTADTLKLIDAGKAEFGIADGSDLAGQIDAGRGAKGVMAIVQRPQGQLITLAESEITDPSQLEGHSVGVTGVPSDGAVLDTIVRDAGGDPDEIEVVTIGFNGVQALENGALDGFVGFAADGTQVEADGFPVRAFALDEFGGPAYPGLVVFSTEERIADDPDVISAFVECTVAGYESTLADPQAALAALLAEVPALDPELSAAQLELYESQFLNDTGRFGKFDEQAVDALSDFLLANDLAKTPISAARYATNDFLPGQAAGETND